jgi:hypothetical protein
MRLPAPLGPFVAAVVAWLALVPVGFYYAASGLVASGPGLFLMWLLFLALLGVAVWLTRRRSYLVLLVPVVAGGAWLALISIGEAYWGWSP